MNKICYILILFLFTNCNQENNSIDYLNIVFVEKGLTSQIPISCDRLKGKWDTNTLFNKKINSQLFIKKFEKLYKNYQTSKEKTDTIIDARIKIIIYLKNNNIDTLCLGENFNTYLNGKKMIDSPKLLKLIKEEIY